MGDYSGEDGWGHLREGEEEIGKGSGITINSVVLRWK